MPAQETGSHDLVSITIIHEDPTIADAWGYGTPLSRSKRGMKVANAKKIPALFIQQQNNELIESRSDALNALDSLTIH